MNKPFVCCAVIVNDREQYLLIKRGKEPCKGQWSFISGIGASKKGLAPNDAVEDEVVYDVSAKFSGELHFEYDLIGVDYADKVYVFLGRIDEDALCLNPKAATEVKWFTYEELQTMGSLAFGDIEILDRIRSKYKLTRGSAK